MTKQKVHGGKILNFFDFHPNAGFFIYSLSHFAYHLSVYCHSPSGSKTNKFYPLYILQTIPKCSSHCSYKNIKYMYSRVHRYMIHLKYKHSDNAGDLAPSATSFLDRILWIMQQKVFLLLNKQTVSWLNYITWRMSILQYMCKWNL